MESNMSVKALPYPRRYAGSTASMLEKYFSVKQVLGIAIIFFIALKVSLVLAYAILALWSLRSINHSLQALVLAVIFTSIVSSNAGPGSGLLRWFVLFPAWLHIYYYAFIYKRFPNIIHYLLLFSIAVFILSLFASYAPGVSIMKIISFTLGVGAAISGFYLSNKDTVYWTNWFYSLFIVLILLSLLSLFTPFLGGSARGFGFYSIFNNPNAFGIVLSPLLALLTGKYFFQEINKKNMYIVIGAGWVFVILSMSRTSVLAIVLSSLSVALIYILMKPKTWVLNLKKILHSQRTILISVVLFISMFSATIIYEDNIKFFMFKSQSYSHHQNIHWHYILERLEDRQERVSSQQIENFLQNPLMGIGFQLKSNPSHLRVKREPIFGIPIGASVEKSFLPTTILEEIGIIGTIFFILLMLQIFKILTKRSIRNSLLFFTILFVNLGELVIFSAASIGLFYWLLIGFALQAPKGRPAG